MVSSETSLALLRALQTAHNSQDYRLPAADYDDDLNSAPFELRGWIETNNLTKGIDDYDPWSAGISFPGLLPAEWFIEICDLRSGLDGRKWFLVGENNIPALVSTTWAMRLDERNDEETESGTSLIANRDRLAQMLSLVDMDLIIEVQLSRRYAYNSREANADGNSDWMPPYSLIIRIDKHGKITTL